MKSLENFQNEKIEMKSIWGGDIEATKDSSVNGAGCTVIMTDKYDDRDGDKKWDLNETGTRTITTICPPPR